MPGLRSINSHNIHKKWLIDVPYSSDGIHFTEYVHECTYGSPSWEMVSPNNLSLVNMMVDSEGNVLIWWALVKYNYCKFGTDIRWIYVILWYNLILWYGLFLWYSLFLWFSVILWYSLILWYRLICESTCFCDTVLEHPDFEVQPECMVQPCFVVKPGIVIQADIEVRHIMW